MSAVPQLCTSCGVPLADGQQYCLECGTRNGPRRAEVEQLKANAGAGSTPVAPPPAAGAASGLPHWMPNLRLPSLPICGVLLMMFFGSGIALGAYERHSANDALARAANQQIRFLAAAGKAPAPATSPETSEPSAPTPSREKVAKTAPLPATQPTERETEEPEAAEKTTPTSERKPLKALPPVKHVFVIALSDEAYVEGFGPSSNSAYLSKTLLKEGELLTGYYAVAHEELANLVALVSGQGPTLQTAENCPRYEPLAVKATAAHEQLVGTGCVYPASTASLPSELEAKRLAWRAYLQGVNESGAATCPTESSGSYASYRDPFVYLGSVTASPSGCASHLAGLSALAGDLASAGRTPNVSFVIPDLCNDGSATPPASCKGTPAGAKGAESFLRRVVPQITGSAAFKQNGLLVITFDQAPQSGPLGFEATASCCSQPLYPNLPAPEGGVATGGGAVGALLLSPWVKGGATAIEQYNHFSLLKTIDELFGLRAAGYAALRGVAAFAPSLFLSRP
jgi:hypothetical protein